MVLTPRMRRDGEVDAILSAGNRCAIGGWFFLYRWPIKGWNALAVSTPTVDSWVWYARLRGQWKIHPEPCIQYAVMGSYYAENVRGIQNLAWVYWTMGQKLVRDTLCWNLPIVIWGWVDSFIGNVERVTMDGVADVVVADGFCRKRCLENDGKERLLRSWSNWNKRCWKLGGEIRSFSAQGPLEIIEANLGFLRCWRSGLVWSSSTCC